MKVKLAKDNQNLNSDQTLPEERVSMYNCRQSISIQMVSSLSSLDSVISVHTENNNFSFLVWYNPVKADTRLHLLRVSSVLFITCINKNNNTLNWFLRYVDFISDNIFLSIQNNIFYFPQSKSLFQLRINNLNWLFLNCDSLKGNKFSC